MQKHQDCVTQNCQHLTQLFCLEKMQACNHLYSWVSMLFKLIQKVFLSTTAQISGSILYPMSEEICLKCFESYWTKNELHAIWACAVLFLLLLRELKRERLIAMETYLFVHSPRASKASHLFGAFQGDFPLWSLSFLSVVPAVDRFCQRKPWCALKFYFPYVISSTFNPHIIKDTFFLNLLMLSMQIFSVGVLFSLRISN